MIIIHAVDTVPRLATPSLDRSAAVAPVTVVPGARQTEKHPRQDLAAAGERAHLSLVEGNVKASKLVVLEGTTMAGFEHLVTSEQELRDIVGLPGARPVLKERPTLDTHSRAFIARSPFLLIASAGADGRCDVSPKGDAPGFVLVLDDTRLVIPDRPGNKRLDGMMNLLTNPHIGLIFFVPGREETLRVNGRAWMTRDTTLLEQMVVEGKTPHLAIGVEVEQCFMHCPKAFKRSHLWAPEQWPAPDALPSMARVLFDQIQPAGVTREDFERDVAASNSTSCLY
jgi:PPOX class probable FMN-dependent enzyme